MMQRQISIDREEPEAGLEALEEPLKAKKPRDKWPGRSAQRYPCLYKTAVDSKLYIFPDFLLVVSEHWLLFILRNIISHVSFLINENITEHNFPQCITSAHRIPPATKQAITF